MTTAMMNRCHRNSPRYFEAHLANYQGRERQADTPIGAEELFHLLLGRKLLESNSPSNPLLDHLAQALRISVEVVQNALSVTHVLNV